VNSAVVRQIYALLTANEQTHQQIADGFNVSRVTVTGINQGYYHKHLAPAGWKPSPPVSACGERNGASKLREEEAREIFRLAWTGHHTLRQIGDKFGVSLSQVHLVKTKREWKYLWRKDNQPMTETNDLRAEIDALKKRQTELEAKLAEGKPPEPFKSAPMERFDPTARASMDAETMKEWSRAISPALARDLHNDLAWPNPVTGATPSQLSQDRGGVEIRRGSGWAEPNPIRQPEGVALCDRLVDAQDLQDRHDLARRLARATKGK
jgi:transposase